MKHLQNYAGIDILWYYLYCYARILEDCLSKLMGVSVNEGKNLVISLMSRRMMCLRFTYYRSHSYENKY